MSAALPRSAVTTNLRERHGFARSALLALVGTVALVISAKIQVPFWPVPMTMQSVTVLLIGFAFGSRLGAATLILYLAEGLVGLPVFAGTSGGSAVFAGPTGGYLFGFVVAAFIVGWLAESGWDRGIGHVTATLMVGHCALFVPGVAWLAVLFGPERAVAYGLTPFLLATGVKTALGVALVTFVWPRLLGGRAA